MTTLLPKTKQPRRKTRIVILHAEIFRKPREVTWWLKVESTQSFNGMTLRTKRTRRARSAGVV